MYRRAPPPPALSVPTWVGPCWRRQTCQQSGTKGDARRDCPGLGPSGRNPSRACRQCSVPRWPAALCLVCREGPDTPEHVLLECPCLAGVRLRLLGNIRPEATQLRDGGAVAALARGYLWHREPLATVDASRPEEN